MRHLKLPPLPAALLDPDFDEEMQELITLCEEGEMLNSGLIPSQDLMLTAQGIT